MQFQTMAPYSWRCYEWYRTGSRAGDDCSWVDCKGMVGGSEVKRETVDSYIKKETHFKSGL